MYLDAGMSVSLSGNAPYGELMADRVTHEETRYVWLVAGAVMLLAAAPVVLAALWPSPALQFCGFLIGVEDGNSYLAKMLQGAQGQWTVQLVYSTEAQRGGFFFLVYVLLGKVARLTGVSQVVILHLARLLAIPWALYSFYRLAAFFTPRPAVRRLALVLFAFHRRVRLAVGVFGLPAQLGDMPGRSVGARRLLFPLRADLSAPPLETGIAVLGSSWAHSVFLAGGRLVDALLAAFAGLGCSLIHPYTPAGHRGAARRLRAVAGTAWLESVVHELCASHARHACSPCRICSMPDGFSVPTRSLRSGSARGPVPTPALHST